MRHDIRHLLNHLWELSVQGDNEAVKDYLSGITVQVSHRETEEYCKNEMVNGLLQYYAGMAADKGISCRVRAKCGDVAIAPADLTVLFGNLMENAIHACEQEEAEESRWITVEVGVIGASLLIQTENYCQTVYPSGKYCMEEGGSFLHRLM